MRGPWEVHGNPVRNHLELMVAPRKTHGSPMGQHYQSIGDLWVPPGSLTGPPWSWSAPRGFPSDMGLPWISLPWEHSSALADGMPM